MILKHSITASKLVTIVFLSLAIVFAVNYFDIKNQNDKLKKQLQLDSSMHVNELKEILDRYDIEIIKNKYLINRNKVKQQRSISISKKFDKIRYEVGQYKKANSYNTSSNNENDSINLSQNEDKTGFKKEADSFKNSKPQNAHFTESDENKKPVDYKKVENHTVVSTIKNLTTKNVIGSGIKIVSNNILETMRSSCAQQIKVCFTLLENNYVFRGNKDIYIQIINPNKTIISKNDACVDFENKEIHYSAKTIVFYDNEDLDVSIFVDSDKEKLVKGDYEINIFSNASLIGNALFSLK